MSKVSAAGLDIINKKPRYGPKPVTAAMFKSFSIPDETIPSAFLRKIQDKMRRGKTVIRAVKAQGGKVDLETNFYLADEALPSWTLERVEAFEKAYVKPIIDLAATRVAALNRYKRLIQGKQPD